MSLAELNKTARAMVADGKGILAADESTSTIKKRFDAIGTESTEATRRAYRDLLFTTPGMEKFISGVIMYDETIRQSTAAGVPFPQYLAKLGVIPGIKVDAGAKPLAGHSGEKVTEGLDGLRDRFKEYASLGARFAKWRAVITIGDGIPSRACVSANAHALARYAALAQEAGIVPIVEPEVLMDGDHDIERCEEVTGQTLAQVFKQLRVQGVALEGMLL
ncbi:MAG TPA: class I fructose-bisphosphate aldolase, partial [Gammaproteobacteria bacterium]|nr:class I fructose-bisphosphate aldolase [Gammaproteobacteria bacterium]